MADDELAEIRRRRAAEFQNQAMDQQAAEEERERARTAVQMALMEILEPEARERLNTIRLTRPEFAASVEQQLIMLARQGQHPAEDHGRAAQRAPCTTDPGQAGLQYRPQVMKAGVLFSGGKDSALAALLLAPHYEVEVVTFASDAGRNLAAVEAAGSALGLAWRGSAPPRRGARRCRRSARHRRIPEQRDQPRAPLGARGSRRPSIPSSPTGPGSMTGCR